ncbi:MAG TPA: glycosyltransferase family 4 protein [Thermomicrobiales bacterium]|jgi:glycosyltransferase involved in cell wall biosynthesis
MNVIASPAPVDIPADRRPTQISPLRFVGISRGDPHSPHDTSGVPRSLFNALERRYTLVDRVDTRLPLWQQALVALATFHPQRTRWIERYFKNLLAFDLISRRTRVKLGAVAEPYDLVLQLNGLFHTQGAPYMLYLDNTYRDSALGWPDWNPLRGRRLAHWYARERALYQGANHIFVMAHYVAQTLGSFYAIPPERISVVGGGVNIDVATARTGLGEEHAPTILFVGKEFARKGCDTLIAAFRAVRAQRPEARLQIVGPVVPVEAGVESIGRIADKRQLAQLYAEATVFCLPSRFDPFPGALIEAMAHGIPCVSTKVCGIPEIVSDGETGVLVPPDDPELLAGALLRLLDDPAYAARLGAAGRRRTEEHLNWDRVIERMGPALERYSVASVNGLL